FQLLLEYAIRKVQEKHVRLKLTGTHQLLVYADNVIILGDNIDTIKKNTNIKIGNRCFENVAQFRYFWTTVTNQNFFHGEIKRKLNSGSDCYLVCCLKTN
ncbi:hypothetical protein B7P43_G15145, partial [Cryptotermes secundus]